MPSGLVEEEHGVGAGCHGCRDLRKMKAHRRRVAAGQDESCSLALLGADGAENVGRAGALVLRCGRPCAALGPAPCDLVLLADAGLVGEPDFYVGRIDPLAPRDFRQEAGETFLKSSIAPSAWA